MDNSSVIDQAVAVPETKAQSQEGASDKEMNFRRLEQAKEAERDARIRAEMRNEALEQRMLDMESRMQPKEVDPLDGADDIPDIERLKAKFEKERTRSEKDTRRIFREEIERAEKENYLQRLKSNYPDFDQVMTEENLANLEKLDPEFIQAAILVPDQYAKREMTFKKLKRIQAQSKAEPKHSIKEKVEENAKNPFYIPSSAAQTGPSGMDYDLSTREQRDKAYARLKEAQRRPIGR